ncbi:MAG: tetratricopeptide repeat protein [Bacteroidia bacterium]|nr:tetratricopeptide repeat protein [Bacteroidia bacterium]
MDRLTQLLDFLSKAPQDPFNLYSVAYEYMQMGEIAKAESYFLKLRELHPDYVGLYYHLGKIYIQKSNYEEALKVLEEGKVMAKKAKDRHAEGELDRAIRQVKDELEDW